MNNNSNKMSLLRGEHTSNPAVNIIMWLLHISVECLALFKKKISIDIVARVSIVNMA